MFWKLISGVTRTALAVNKTVTALGFAIIVGVAVHDFLGNRKKEKQSGQLRRFD